MDEEDNMNGQIQELGLASEPVPLSEEAQAALAGTSLDSPAQRDALAQMPPAIRQIFIKSAQIGEPVSALAYCQARGQRRENPMVAAARHATEEDLFEFLSVIEDMGNKRAIEIWRQAELNSLIWG